ncbi:LysE family translocator [Aquamicrobium segne]|uniref:LysE family translocator n=1 Tax=Aquamicrobium segne TaxID=469547 RepID=A0ABW0H0H3_9HYPH
MSPSLLAAYWAFSFLFVITPGVDWAYMISISPDHRAIGPAVFGLLARHLTAVALVAAGVGAVVAGAPAVLAALTYVGAGYLVWLGIGMVRHPALPVAGEVEFAGSSKAYAIKGYGMSALNPKVPLLYLALLPQFTDLAGSWPVSAQIMVLGLLTIISCTIIYTMVGYASHSVLRANPAVTKIVSRLSGAVMIIVAIALIAERFAS